MIRKLWRRFFPPPPEPPDPRPAWIRDETFMAWLEATKRVEHNLVTGFGPHAWQDWKEGTWGGEGSFTGAAIERCRWRFEGWLGARTARGDGFFVPPAGPPDWWLNAAFLAWHDLQFPSYAVEMGGSCVTAGEIGREVSEDPSRIDKGALLYRQSKALERRYQGWCGVLQLVSGRVVCPRCGSWDVDNLDTETCLCMAEGCNHEWKPTWPKGGAE